MSKRPREDEGASDSSGVVEFNVGGRIFAAARTTLCSYPSSMLARMFSESDAIGHTRDSMGRIFLCRDPDIFVHILAYLRNSRLVCPLASCDIVRDHSHSELEHHRSYAYVETPKCLAVTKQPLPDPIFLQMADAEADYLGLDSMRADIARVARRMPAKFWFDRGCKVELMKAWGYAAEQLAGVESTNVSFPRMKSLCTVSPVASCPLALARSRTERPPTPSRLVALPSAARSASSCTMKPTQVSRR